MLITVYITLCALTSRVVTSLLRARIVIALEVILLWRTTVQNEFWTVLYFQKEGNMSVNFAVLSSRNP